MPAVACGSASAAAKGVDRASSVGGPAGGKVCVDGVRCVRMLSWFLFQRPLPLDLAGGAAPMGVC